MNSPPSLRTRPTSDRLRETLFNILAPRIEGARFLDLCAGSGAVGIEALSRGAAYVTFVDQSSKMCSLIEANLNSLEIDESKISIVVAKASQLFGKMWEGAFRPFDVIFFDPAYSSDYESILELVGAGSLLARDGLLIVEHFHKRSLADEFGGLHRHRQLKQGDSCLSFYQALSQ